MAIGPEMLAGELIWQTHTDFSIIEWVMTVVATTFFLLKKTSPSKYPN
jgi:hypothetical protein